jgi:hypothetical protein
MPLLELDEAPVKVDERLLFHGASVPSLICATSDDGRFIAEQHGGNPRAGITGTLSGGEKSRVLPGQKRKSKDNRGITCIQEEKEEK